MRSQIKPVVTLIVALVAIFLLWDYSVLYPLKILVVFFHESSHALMVIVTGGNVEDFVINQQQGGQVISLGGNRLLTLNAGYLGSLIWGMVVYLVAVRTRQDKLLMFILGGGIIAIAVSFSRDVFALGFCLAMGGAMLVLAIKASMKINDAILRLIGLTSMMYVPLDIYSDTISRSHLNSDAFMLADEIGGTTILWGSLWIALSVVMVVVTIWFGLKEKSE